MSQISEETKLFCPMNPELEVEVCDYNLETRSCSMVCNPTRVEQEQQNQIRLQEMSDEILFQAIQMQATQLNGYTRNIKSFVDKFEIGNAESQVVFLKQEIERFEKLIEEAKEKARV